LASIGAAPIPRQAVPGGADFWGAGAELGPACA